LKSINCGNVGRVFKSTIVRKVTTVLDVFQSFGIPFQVAGELSNAGQPMRRFMQTFILAPQSPKKYYVHNDIFRYQDEVFHDVATDSEPDVAGEFLCRVFDIAVLRLL